MWLLPNSYHSYAEIVLAGFPIVPAPGTGTLPVQCCCCLSIGQHTEVQLLEVGPVRCCDEAAPLLAQLVAICYHFTVPSQTLTGPYLSVSWWAMIEVMR
jgi:hypothetical protein